MLIALGEMPPAHDLSERLERAIHDDNRIVEATPVSINEEWVFQTSIYPRRSETTDEALLSNEDERGAIRFKGLATFIVKVPIKNQPLFRGEGDIPTDTYYVAWDGITAVVMWRRGPEDRRPPRSAGHIVIDVLRDIAKAVGLMFYAQACSPGCTNVFAHRVMRIERLHGARTFSLRGTDNHTGCVDVHLHSDGTPTDIVRSLLLNISQEGYTFAIYKNYAAEYATWKRTLARWLMSCSA